MVAYFSLRTSKVLYTTCSRSAASFLLIIILLVSCSSRGEASILPELLFLLLIIRESGRTRTATSVVNSYPILRSLYSKSLLFTDHRTPCHCVPLRQPHKPTTHLYDRSVVIFRRLQLPHGAGSRQNAAPQLPLTPPRGDLSMCPKTFKHFARHFATPEDTLHPVTGGRTYTICQRTANLSVSPCHRVTFFVDDAKVLRISVIANF